MVVLAHDPQCIRGRSVGKQGFPSGGSKNYPIPHFDFLTPMKKISDPQSENRWGVRGLTPHENMLISIKNWEKLT